MGFEPATRRTEGAELTTEPPRPTIVNVVAVLEVA